MSTQTTEEREPMQVRILPSLRVKIDQRRAVTRQSLSDWIEEVVRAALAQQKGQKP